MNTSSNPPNLRVRKTHEKRGRIDGHAEEDWKQAEAEILAGKKTAAAA